MDGNIVSAGAKIKSKDASVMVAYASFMNAVEIFTSTDDYFINAATRFMIANNYIEVSVFCFISATNNLKTYLGNQMSKTINEK